MELEISLLVLERAAAAAACACSSCLGLRLLCCFCLRCGFGLRLLCRCCLRSLLGGDGLLVELCVLLIDSLVVRGDLRRRLGPGLFTTHKNPSGRRVTEVAAWRLPM